MRLLRRIHCSEDELVALLDGELSLPERLAVERHLADCERCARLAGRIEKALCALAAELAVDPAAGEPAAAPQWRLRPAVRVAGAGVLAGSVGALVVAGLIRRHQHQRRFGLRLPGAA